MIIEDGTVKVTTGSQDLVFENASIFSSGVKAGDRIKIEGYAPILYMGATPTNNVNGKLLWDYAGATQENANYQIFQDVYDYGLLKIQKGISESYDAIHHNFDIVSKELINAGSPSSKSQVLQKFCFGEPVEGREFGFFTPTFAISITKLRPYTDGNTANVDMVLDIAIDGVYQGLNITIPANQLWKTSDDLTYKVEAGQLVNFKWIDVPSGSSVLTGIDWGVEIVFNSDPELIIRYDYTGFIMGELTEGKIIGRGFKFPVKSKVLKFHYEFLDLPPQGSDAVIEIIRNPGLSVEAGVTGNLTENNYYGVVDVAQLDFETTEEFNIEITQVGSSFPGSGLIIVPHTCRIE